MASEIPQTDQRRAGCREVDQSPHWSYNRFAGLSQLSAGVLPHHHRCSSGSSTAEGLDQDRHTEQEAGFAEPVARPNIALSRA